MKPSTHMLKDKIPQAFLDIRITTITWHVRLDHPFNSTIIKVINTNNLTYIRNTLSFCQDYVQAKAHVLSFSSSSSTSSFSLQVVHFSA
jgi:hypothetical protein